MVLVGAVVQKRANPDALRTCHAIPDSRAIDRLICMLERKNVTFANRPRLVPHFLFCTSLLFETIPRIDVCYLPYIFRFLKLIGEVTKADEMSLFSARIKQAMLKGDVDELYVLLIDLIVPDNATILRPKFLPVLLDYFWKIRTSELLTELTTLCRYSHRNCVALHLCAFDSFLLQSIADSPCDQALELFRLISSVASSDVVFRQFVSLLPINETHPNFLAFINFLTAMIITSSNTPSLIFESRLSIESSLDCSVPSSFCGGIHFEYNAKFDLF
jgi:hypothetical protein